MKKKSLREEYEKYTQGSFLFACVSVFLTFIAFVVILLTLENSLLPLKWGRTVWEEYEKSTDGLFFTSMCFRFGMGGAKTETAVGEEAKQSETFTKHASSFLGSYQILIFPPFVQIVKESK